MIEMALATVAQTTSAIKGFVLRNTVLLGGLVYLLHVMLARSQSSSWEMSSIFSSQNRNSKSSRSAIAFESSSIGPSKSRSSAISNSSKNVRSSVSVVSVVGCGVVDSVTGAVSILALVKNSMSSRRLLFPASLSSKPSSQPICLSLSFA